MTDETLTQLEYIKIILDNRKIKTASLVKPKAQEYAWWGSNKRDRIGTGNFWAIMATEASPWEPQIRAARETINICVEDQFSSFQIQC